VASYVASRRRSMPLMTYGKQDPTNYIDREWQKSSTGKYLHVDNPPTADILIEVSLSPPTDDDQAVQSAVDAADSWRRVPLSERVRYLFKPGLARREYRRPVALYHTRGVCTVFSLGLRNF
jgi:acyl-CoA reductase-like NAD-dependent aldehyde dehydrogenase